MNGGTDLVAQGQQATEGAHRDLKVEGGAQVGVLAGHLVVKVDEEEAVGAAHPNPVPPVHLRLGE